MYGGEFEGGWGDLRLRMLLLTNFSPRLLYQCNKKLIIELFIDSVKGEV